MLLHGKGKEHGCSADKSNETRMELATNDLGELRIDSRGLAFCVAEATAPHENHGCHASGGTMNSRMTSQCQVTFALVFSLTAVGGCASEPAEAQQTSSVSPGKIHYYYDALGRLLQAAAADGTGVQYSYDPVGNITAIRR